MNRWNNQPPYMYAQERNRWQKILANTFALWPKREGMRTLVITRFVQSKRHLIKDHDNLIGGAKPIKDVLTRVGVLADDNDKILTFTVLQEVDATNPRTEITLD